MFKADYSDYKVSVSSDGRAVLMIRDQEIDTDTIPLSVPYGDAVSFQA